MPLDPNSSVSVSDAPSEWDNAQPLPSPSVDEMNYATQVQTPAQSSSILDSIPSLEQMSAYLANAPQAAQRFLTNPAAFTQMITGSNPLPEQTGFAASATGLPAQNPNSLFTPEGMAYNTGYESGEPIGIAAGAIPALGEAAPVLARAAGERILAGKSLIPGVPSELVNPQIMSAVKEKGGNWLDKGLDSLDWMKKPIEQVGSSAFDSAWDNANPVKIANHISEMEQIGYAPDQIADFKSKVAINNWIDSKLKKYVRNEMGTPQDPVRELADQGITHLPNVGEFNPDYAPSVEDTKVQRAAAGLPVQGFAKTPLGKHWEYLTDQAIRNKSAGMYVKQGESPSAYGTIKQSLEDNPWLRTVDPKTPVHATSGFVNDTEFGHLTDELKNSISPNTDLPANLRLKPESLDRVTVPQAVQHVAKINKWRAEQMAKATKDDLKDFPIVHEGGNGYNIHELKLPESKVDLPWAQEELSRYSPEELKTHQNNYTKEKSYQKLDKALKNEGKQMGHCVGGYTDSVASGDSRIFSLRDPKGGAHATVEATPVKKDYVQAILNRFGSQDKFLDAYHEQVKAGKINPDIVDPKSWLDTLEPENKINIKQIKGKGNGAVNDKYRTYIKDWLNKEADKIGHVEDLHNVGLTDLKNGVVKTENLHPTLREKFSNGEIPRFLSDEDVQKAFKPPVKTDAEIAAEARAKLFEKSRADEAARKANEPRTLEQRMRDQGLLPPEGHKNGGKIENRPKIDEMRYELARKR